EGLTQADGPAVVPDDPHTGAELAERAPTGERLEGHWEDEDREHDRDEHEPRGRVVAEREHRQARERDDKLEQHEEGEGVDEPAGPAGREGHGPGLEENTLTGDDSVGHASTLARREGEMRG